MSNITEPAMREDGFYLAGERVSPGQYRQVDVYGREIILETEGILPASLDGRVACYSRVSNLWGQISSRAACRPLQTVNL